MTTDKRQITVGEFLEQLKTYDKDRVLYFGGLDFYRFKYRDPDYLQVEFAQQVYTDSLGNVVVENNI